jgi:hypothetical protein
LLALLTGLPCLPTTLEQLLNFLPGLDRIFYQYFGDFVALLDAVDNLHTAEVQIAGKGNFCKKRLNGAVVNSWGRPGDFVNILIIDIMEIGNLLKEFFFGLIGR